MLHSPMSQLESNVLAPAAAQRAITGAPLSGILILDTQIVMDWLVFDDNKVRPIVAAIESRHLHWVATEAMKAELLHVLGRGVAATYKPNLERVNEGFSRHCEFIPAPDLGMPRPRCTDQDDQKFIDLAISCSATRPTCLISRDRAVLKVAKRAAKLGVDILSPAAWIKRQAIGQ